MLPKLTEDLNIVQKLADRPAMSADELKAKFDEASGKIKNYINDTLTPAVDEFEPKLEDLIEQGSVAVSPTQPITKEKVWFQTGKERKVHTKEDGGEFKEFLVAEDIPKVSPTEPQSNVWFQKGNNLFDKNSVLSGRGLQASDGTDYSLEGWFVSDYIIISNLNNYYLSGKTSGSTNAFYDENKKFISSVSQTNGFFSKSTIPANARYIRFNSQINVLGTTMFNITITDEKPVYEPYISKKILTKNSKGVFEEFYNEIKVIDSLKSDDSVNALSAKQGKEMNSKISSNAYNVERKVNGYYAGNNPDIDNGVYRGSSGVYGMYGCSKAPSVNIGILSVYCYTKDWVVQEWREPLKRGIWQRAFTSGSSWSGWNKIA